jgi:hypothetical protein
MDTEKKIALIIDCDNAKANDVPKKLVQEVEKNLIKF